MGKVTESIWSNENYIIPLADVQFISKLHDSTLKDRIFVVFKNSKLDEFSTWNPHVYLDGKNGESFKKEFCRYRHELELETLDLPLSLSPDSTQKESDAVLFSHWLMDNCELAEDNSLWRYESEEYSPEGIYEVFTQSKKVGG